MINLHFKIIKHCISCTHVYNILYDQARLKGGANRAIARGPKFWGAHELFFFYFLYENKNFLNYFSYILLILIKTIKII